VVRIDWNNQNGFGTLSGHVRRMVDILDNEQFSGKSVNTEEKGGRIRKM